MDWLWMAPGHQVVDRELNLIRRTETLLVKVVHVKLHGDEFQPVFIWNDDPHGDACIFDNLLFHA
ncbi:hypothetical protein AJ87_02615 [Rhizobium yanglingense]|nr:hypothetical protein AJ87_02615 [Rhizobium yanglingense]